MKKFAKYIKAARINAGLMQIDVAKALGYSSPQFVSNWERGLSLPPASALKVLAKLYKLNHADLGQLIIDEQLRQYKVKLESEL